MPKASAKIRIGFRSSKELNSVFNSLKPELHYSPGDRATAMARAYKRTLQLNFEAKDSTALRSIVSSFLRITKVSLDTCDTLATTEDQTRRHCRGRS